MADQMVRPTPEEARRLKEKGYIDVGVSYAPVGISRPPKHKFWDGYVPPEDDEDTS